MNTLSQRLRKSGDLLRRNKILREIVKFRTLFAAFFFGGLLYFVYQDSAQNPVSFSDDGAFRQDPEIVKLLDILNDSGSDNEVKKKTFEKLVLFGHPFLKLDLRYENLTGAKIPSAYLPNANFEGANLSFSDLSNAYLLGADFSGANLNGASFRGADLTGVNFSDAKMVAADMRGAIVMKSKFENSMLKSAKLGRSLLWGANFIGADLTQADFTGADLSEAILMNRPGAEPNITQRQIDVTCQFPFDMGPPMIPEGLRWSGRVCSRYKYNEYFE
ncbi:pentapeptide repeat-containing protein [Rhodospirillaceae bacterium KN72]|uniref:Pentapeptide repeat-containing protein n=1 Tax=Pacificispira spongiicola TaxID=2729598 RepID=A0A7Y0HDA8_9PROT|nr:pentapeptide repeat-containing protein [Pacificispira spongiicola]NMM43611.1 pentapeptide repeat-containing protein [Pacificispira spongiicola]